MALIVGTMGLAMAQTVGTASTGTGSITIKNASKGDTYKVFRLFDATLTNTDSNPAAGTAYTGDIPDALSSIFEKDEAGNIQRKEAYKGAGKDADVAAVVQAWAADLEETDPHFVTKATIVNDKINFT